MNASEALKALAQQFDEPPFTFKRAADTTEAIDDLIKARIIEYMEANTEGFAGGRVVHDEWPTRHIEIPAPKKSPDPA